jgi:hypothetical protein
MTDATTPQKRAALSEPRVGAYTEKQLSEVRRHHADTPCVITGTHETCRLLATVNEREEALQRVHRLNHFSVMVPRVSSNSLSSAPMEVVSWADILTAIEVKQ